jgi:diguanylate cyclase (GGDEF)-like protein
MQESLRRPAEDRGGPVNRPEGPTLIDAVILGLLYYLGARVGVSLTVMPEGTAILWPPNSVLLAALLRFQGRRYPLLVALAMAAELAADLPAFSLMEALLFGVINVMEATIAFVLLFRWQFNTGLATLEDVRKFVLAGPVVAAFISALCGAAVYKYFRGTETGYLEFVRIWWFGDGLGLMICTPLLLGLWPYVDRQQRDLGVKLRPALDSAVGLTALVTLAAVIASRDGMLFGIHVGPVLLVPFVLFVAARFGTLWASVAIAIASITVVAMVTHDRRPFGAIDIRVMVVVAQEFIFITSLMGLGLAALLAELHSRRTALEVSNRRLQEMNRDLESRVELRTTELRRMNAQLEELALTDALTGLMNRRAFGDLAGREIALCRRENRSLALILLDIDRFKSINDRYGHPCGDIVLQRVAAVLTRVIRAGDTAVRHGGEEFVVVLPATDKEGAVNLAERIRNSLQAEAIRAGEEILHVTASLGVAVMGEADENLGQILRRADEAMYAAKAAGRNRVIAAWDLDAQGA